MINAAIRFKALFRGNDRSFGVLNLKTNNAITEKGSIPDKNYEDHVEGKRGLGVVPINDNDACYFAAIDVDRHGSDTDADFVALANEFSSKKLPVIVCRSRSGGAHCYVFFSEPVKAVAARRLLNKWVSETNVPEYCTSGFELFPKQDVLVRDDSGDKALGNWLNLPYVGGDNTERYATINGKKAPLDLFLTTAETIKISAAEVLNYLNGDHAEAPPCIQSMMTGGVESGFRNQAMYNITVYLKKAFPDDYRDKAYDLNQRVFDKPLSYVELKRTVNSAGRRDYRYKCGEEPCKSVCDRNACVKRQYGITKSEYKDLENEDRMPAVTEMIKYDTDPIKWGVVIEGKLINNIITEDLYDSHRMRMRISEALQIPVPQLTNKFWFDRVIEPLMPSARVESTPTDASLPGVIWARLKEFTRKADTRKDGSDAESKKILFTGSPVVHATKDGDKVIIFRAQDFVQYLKRTKSEELKGPNLWFALKNSGSVDHLKLRIGKQTVNVWSVPMEMDEELPETPDFTPEY